MKAFIGRFGVPSAFSVWLVSASESSNNTTPLGDIVYFKCNTAYRHIQPRSSTSPHTERYFLRRNPIESLARRVARSEGRGDRRFWSWKDMDP